MKFLLLCVVLSATLAAINAAGIQETQTKENGETEAKKSVLVDKLKELFKKSTLKTENDDGEKRENDVNGNPNVRPLPTQRRGMARFQRRGGSQNRAPIMGQDGETRRKIKQLLQRHIPDIKARKMSATAGRQTPNRRVLQSRNSGPARQKLHNPSARTNEKSETKKEQPVKLDKAPTDRRQSSHDIPDSCYCYSIMNSFYDDYHNDRDWCYESYGELSGDDYNMYCNNGYVYDYEYAPSCDQCYNLMNEYTPYDQNDWEYCFNSYGDLKGHDYSICNFNINNYGSENEYLTSCNTPCSYGNDQDCDLWYLLSDVYYEMVATIYDPSDPYVKK